MATLTSKVLIPESSVNACKQYLNPRVTLLNLLTQICGNNLMVLKAAPPLVVSEAPLNESVAAVREVVNWRTLRRRFGAKH
jgi:hypothetical protein